MSISDVLTDHPDLSTFDLTELSEAIEAALACAAACSACANACIVEGDLEMMRACILHDLDCADICATTAKVLSRPAPHGHAWRAIVQACSEVCDACAAECGQHEQAHCRHCAEACRRCADACRTLLAVSD